MKIESVIVAFLCTTVEGVKYMAALLYLAVEKPWFVLAGVGDFSPSLHYLLDLHSCFSPEESSWYSSACPVLVLAFHAKTLIVSGYVPWLLFIFGFKLSTLPVPKLLFVFHLSNLPGV